MPQKFMLLAVIGYVMCASFAAALSTARATPGVGRRFSVVMLNWSAALVFVIVSFPGLLRLNDPFRIDALWPIPPGLIVPLIAGAVLISLYRHPAWTGWWSPAPWLRGVFVTTAVTAWAGASQGARYALFPDWRFVSASLALWATCLIIADLTLLASQMNEKSQRHSGTTKEVLRQCAALPGLLIYIIGIRL